MDSDDKMIGRILTRRDALRLTARAGLGAAGIAWMSGFARGAMPPSTQPNRPLVASPQLTEGPFFVDEKLNRSNLISGTKRPAVIGGAPLSLAVTIYKLKGATYTPMKGVQVDLWHADAAGVYSDEDNPMNRQNTAGQRWLRGYAALFPILLTDGSMRPAHHGGPGFGPGGPRFGPPPRW